MPSFFTLPPRTLRAHQASLIAVGLVWCLLAHPFEAHAKKQTGQKTASGQTSSAKGSTKIKGTAIRSPSEESRAERERRLYRECRGMHDAGACKGFTRRKG